MLPRLPIDDVLPELLKQLHAAGSVVLQAEPGAGKTTRVPPGILDAGLAQLADGRPAKIIVLQPRRVAARAAAARISDERGTTLGAESGYQVRLESRLSKQTRIIVCTEGVFLRRLQDDPLLDDVAVVVFDEFHERSLDSDLALAMTKLVREQVRPDLKLVVMSATLDCGPVSAYLDGCPVVSSPGKTFPVDIRYLQFASSAPIEEMVADGINQYIGKTDGDVLAFLPGVGEIRRTQTRLESLADSERLLVLPLYGDMPLEEQQRVLRKSAGRKIVLSTNVAETSVTIPGVTAVVDSGLARVNKFDANVGLNRLELARISKASATQRAGRAGRTAPGACLRLWTEREHFGLPDFDSPEIERVDLSEAVLRLIAWGEREVRCFNWFEKPPAGAIEAALALLERLEAIDSKGLTEVGSRMSELPLQPRLAKLLIEAQRLGCTTRGALCASLLSDRSPFRRQEFVEPRKHHSDSDVLDRIEALEMYQSQQLRHSDVGELLTNPAKNVLHATDQLLRLVGKVDDSSAASRSSILQAIAEAFADRLCKRRQAKGDRAVMLGGKGVKLAGESAVVDGDLFVAVELIDLDKSELLVRQASAVDKTWLPQSQLTSGVEITYDSSKQKITAMKRIRFGDLVLEETVTAVPSDVDPGALLAAELAAKSDLSQFIDERTQDYMARYQCLREWLPELDLPDLGADPVRTLLPDLCFGCTSTNDLKDRSVIDILKNRLTRDQSIAIDREAPERFSLPNGRSVKLQYEVGKSPVLAARIQDLFGITETPRVARSRVPVLVHLLAPNYRVQQITPDLAGFWKNTYADVKKELKGRYPKHKWPDDPLKP